MENVASSVGSADLKNDNTLRYDVNAPFETLNPVEIKFSGSTNVFPLLYCYLFIPNTKGELVPDLAENWSYDADKLEWTIQLKSRARFHNNLPVKAVDVKYSYDTWIEKHRPDLISIIKEIYPLSDSTLLIRLKHNDTSILYRLWDFEIFPHSENGAIDYYNHPIGSGPYRFAARQANTMITLEANPSYHGGRPAVDRIVFFYQPEREKAWTRLLSGTIDIAQEISPLNYHIIQKYKDRFYFDTYPMRYYTILLYNTYDPLFSNPHIRRALTMGINRNYIVDHILKGYGRIATGPMGIGSPFQNDRLKHIPFDPDKALKILNKAGWRPNACGHLHQDDKLFEFTINVYRENQIDKKVARYIQLCLNNLGIKTHLKALSYQDIKASYFQNTQFQAVLTELEGSYRNPDAIKRIWSAGHHGKAYAGSFDHPEANRLIENAFAKRNSSELTLLMQEIDQLIATLQPGTFIFHKTTIDAMSRRFKLPTRFTLTAEGISRLKHACLDETFKP
jgi:peptide/nickel transport system substrate-binding protein